MAKTLNRRINGERTSRYAQTQVLDYMRQAGGAVTIKEVSETLSMPDSTVAMALQDLADRNEVLTVNPKRSRRNPKLFELMTAEKAKAEETQEQIRLNAARLIARYLTRLKGGKQSLALIQERNKLSHTVTLDALDLLIKNDVVDYKDVDVPTVGVIRQYWWTEVPCTL